MPRSRRWTMPGRSGSDPTSAGQVGQVGKPGDQAVDQGPRAVPGAGVDDQSGRLVHHDHVVVGVDDDEHDRRIALGPGDVHLVGTVHVERLALDQLRAAAGDDLAVDASPARRPRGRRPPRGTRRPAGPRPGPPAPRRATPGPSRRSCSPARRFPRGATQASRMQPTVMQASATLNVGQKWNSTKSTTAPWSPRKNRSARLPSAPPRIRPRIAARPQCRCPPDQDAAARPRGPRPPPRSPGSPPGRG